MAKLTPGDVQVVTVNYEVAGHLKVNPTGKKALELPLAVSSKYRYAERVLELTAGKNRAAQTLRAYEQAVAKIQGGDFRNEVRLRDERQQIACWLAGKRPLLYSPHGPLTREELDLVAIPGNSAVLPALLPGEAMQPGDRWKIPASVAAELLGLDTCGASDVQGTFREVKDGYALLEIGGTASGTVVGVTSDIEVKARLSFDLRARRIAFFALAQREERAMGQFEPGVSAQSTLRLELAPATATPAVGDPVAAGVPATPDLADTLLDFASATGEFGLLLDRHWHVTNDDRFVTTLRLERDGDLVAQCNITRATAVTRDKRITLPQFKLDVQKTLAERFGEFAETTQATTEGGLEVLKVVALGTVQEIPIQWIYYHATAPDGRRVALVITLKAEQIEKLAGHDELLVSGLRFLPRPEPTPAEAPAAAAGVKPSQQR